nr:MAG TPA: Putative transferase, nesg, ydcK, Structural Genomics.38A [Caudoviricetes sp.]
MEKKYKLIEGSRFWQYGRPLYRIQALRDFSDVKKGDLGGFVESEANLSQMGDCWIYDMAQAVEKSIVEGDACLRDCSKMYGSSLLKDKAQLQGCARMIQYASLEDNAVAIDAEISGFATITGDVVIRRKKDYMVFSDIPETDFYATYTFPNKRWRFVLFKGTSKEFIESAPFNDRKRRELIVQIVEEIEKQNKKQTTTITMKQQTANEVFLKAFNARNSEAILDLKAEHGIGGYGVYFQLLEELAANGGKAGYNAARLAYKFHTEEWLVRTIIEDYNIFNYTEDEFELKDEIK